MGTLLICLLAVPSGAGERAAKAPSAMAARRASVSSSVMATRRDARAAALSGVGRAAPVPAPPAAPVVPAAPDFQARITPPRGSPTAGVDLRRDRGVVYAAAAPSAPEPPLPPVGAQGAVGAGPERAPAGVKGAAVTELKAGRTDRQFGGASDPVLFLVGGTGPSGSVTSSSDGSNLSIQLGGQQR